MLPRFAHLLVFSCQSISFRDLGGLIGTDFLLRVYGTLVVSHQHALRLFLFHSLHVRLPPDCPLSVGQHLIIAVHKVTLWRMRSHLSLLSLSRLMLRAIDVGSASEVPVRKAIADVTHIACVCFLPSFLLASHVLLHISAILLI